MMRQFLCIGTIGMFLFSILWYYKKMWWHANVVSRIDIKYKVLIKRGIKWDQYSSRW